MNYSNEDNATIIEGVVSQIIYQNEENGWTVFSMESPKEVNEQLEESFFLEAELICTGFTPRLLSGEEIRLTGKFVMHHTYGEQFQVAFWEKKLPTEQKDMERYLSSGMIKGIGPKLAQRIVNYFKEDTFNIIEVSPERLSEVKGISLNKAVEIGEIFVEKTEERRMMMFFQKHQISPQMSQRIIDVFGSHTIAIVSKNPYVLAEKVSGIGFKTADKMAYELGIERDSIFRIQSAILHCLQEASRQGHIYLPRETLLQHTRGLIFMGTEAIEPVLLSMQLEGSIHQEKLDDNQSLIYEHRVYEKEKAIAKKLLELQQFVFPNPPSQKETIEADIDKLEKETSIKLATEQKEVIEKTFESAILIVTGGPGTGKTTTIAALIKLFLQRDQKVLMAAPTGRAAKRMEEATGEKASTIHRLLEVMYDPSRGVSLFNKNKDNPLEGDLIIIDESSMLDCELLFHLLEAIAMGTHLLFIGDRDQLPSVGAGNVLADMIDSGKIPVITLREIFRQSKESHIITNAHLINQGQFPSISNMESDFFFIQRGIAAEILQEIISLLTKRLPRFLDAKPMEIQLLTPTRKGPLGVEALNKAIQHALNPPGFGKAEIDFKHFTFRVGDKVIQTRNNYTIEKSPQGGDKSAVELGIYNGDEGIITSINQDTQELIIKFEDGSAHYSKKMLEEIELAYALTVHKSQGSEYKAVIMPMYTASPFLLTRNLLYTGITRSKSLCVLVGRTQIMHQMIETQRGHTRFSSLDKRLIDLAWIYE